MFARSFGRLIHSLRFACALRLRTPLRSFVRSLACSLTHSGAHVKEAYVYELNALISYIFSPLCHGAMVRLKGVTVMLSVAQRPREWMNLAPHESSCWWFSPRSSLRRDGNVCG